MANSVRNRVFTHFISPVGDVLFSISVGVAAYALYERDHPREPGCSLLELTSRWTCETACKLRSKLTVRNSEETEKEQVKQQQTSKNES